MGQETCLKVKKWEEFQHYKRRNPPWIRLYRRIVDDADFQCLPLASRALAPMLWLIASETLDGTIQSKPGALSFRLRQSISELLEGLIPLMDKGFIEGFGDFAIEVLAPRLHGATPEAEAETEKNQSQKHVRQTSPDECLQEDFGRFWEVYPKREDKKETEQVWRRLTVAERLAAYAGVLRWRESGRWNDKQFVPSPARYLRRRKWEDEIVRSDGSKTAAEKNHDTTARALSRVFSDVVGDVSPNLPPTDRGTGSGGVPGGPQRLLGCADRPGMQRGDQALRVHPETSGDYPVH